MNNLGETIKNYRMEKGLTLQKAADRLQIDRTTLGRLESNHTQLISIDNLLDISNNLGIDLSRMIFAYGKRLASTELENVLKVSSGIHYNGVALDVNKLKRLINDNIHNIKA